MAEIQFSANDIVKLQFRCERPGGGGIEVTTALSAFELGLTGAEGDDAPIALTAQFDSDSINDALAEAANANTPNERAAALSRAFEARAQYEQALAAQLAEGAQSQGESVAAAVVDWLVAGNLRDEKGEAVNFSRTDGSLYVIRESELNVSQRREVEGHGFFVVTATATWG